MEQERDYLDKLIEQSFEEIKIDNKLSDDYNKRLFDRLHKEKSHSTKTRTAAISLIAAGILMVFMYTTEFQNSIVSLQYKIKADFTTMKEDINIDKYFLGE